MILRSVIEMLAIGLLSYGVYARIKRSPLPVKFKSFDEMDSVHEVARWAQSQFGSNDPRSSPFALLATRVRPFTPGPVPTLPFLVRISVEDLATLAPYIDQAINGEWPRQNLPDDYEDWRPAALRGFKERMKAEGLWPAAKANKPMQFWLFVSLSDVPGVTCTSATPEPISATVRTATRR
jgi:hypothetical protein